MVARFGVLCLPPQICELYSYRKKLYIRIITFSEFRSPSAPLFQRLKILPIFDLVKLLNAQFVSLYLNRLLPLEIINTFNFSLVLDTHDHSTRLRDRGALVTLRVKSKRFGEFSLQYQASRFWNQLQSQYPDTVLHSLSSMNLKRRILNILNS
jgi:hypothetical protein